MTAKPTNPENPKDQIGVRKWRHIVSVPMTVLWEVGIGMMEGAMKYGRHNYRAAGVRASVYVDAAMGHIGQWWEGEDTDADSGLSHITKAICSLIVLRDAMIQDMLVDDRPPRGNLDKVRSDLQKAVDALFEKYPDDVVKPPFTQVAATTALFGQIQAIINASDWSTDVSGIEGTSISVNHNQ
ncbi:hypothetical protein IQ03_02438 [Gemmobacter caeni]|uniref:dATP/dGTP diphosphohydrolase N-terminal domain-containing protein n=1 Tax=Gemmobacter caeni TaxID=589035 RepID=A0A2T6AZ45_9RHOB|nr:dATP/dGTP diphosphohydrolase domain-containing protein [Gemmobacter caeni]PTX49087.1 hypothetical protein C8N34_108197 [Gemmobacter caeni]TWI98912.1 hypothetical protein IQ03_02438 [Gemmobacter caeni]